MRKTVLLAVAIVAVTLLVGGIGAGGVFAQTSTDCASCHAKYPSDSFSSYSESNPVPLQSCYACHGYVNHGYATYVTVYGNFQNAASVNFTNPQTLSTLHSAHRKIVVNASDESCQRCHEGAACTTCHTSPVPHGDHTVLTGGTNNYPGSTETYAKGIRNTIPPYVYAATLTCTNGSCHGSMNLAAGAGGFVARPSCLNCHGVDQSGHGDILPKHESTETAAGCVGQGCHTASVLGIGASNLTTEHATRINPATGQPYDCDTCHKNADPARAAELKAAVTAGDTRCSACHTNAGNHTPLHEAEPAATGCLGDVCHNNNLATEHAARTNPATGLPYDCGVCHAPAARQEARDAIAAYKADGTKSTCVTCHAGAGQHHALHEFSAMDLSCQEAGCHNNWLDDEHAARGMTCATCHSNPDEERAATLQAAIDSHNRSCSACHTDAGNHTALHEAEPPAIDCAKGGCHVNNFVTEHAGRTNPDTGLPYDCGICHSPTARQGAKDAIAAYVASGAKATCTTCHDPYHVGLPATHTASSSESTACGVCHDKDPDPGINIELVHKGNCDLCHNNPDPARIGDIKTKTAECASCHATSGTDYHRNMAVHFSPDADKCSNQCHHGNPDVTVIHRAGCTTCHNPSVNTEGITTACTNCHVAEGFDYHPNINAYHTPTDAATADCVRCHTQSTDVRQIHTTNSCATCHHKPPANYCVDCHVPHGVPSPAPHLRKTAACSACHKTVGTDYHKSLPTKHTYGAMDPSCMLSGCHVSTLPEAHQPYMSKYPEYQDTCALCHLNTTRGPIPPGTTADCSNCHPGAGNHTPLHEATPAATGCTNDGCHANNFATEHAGRTDPATGLPYDCNVCHGTGARDEARDAIAAYQSSGAKATCVTCHAGGNAQHHPLHEFGLMDSTCQQIGCHTKWLDDEHAARGMDCATCHNNPDPERAATLQAAIDSHNRSCSACHTGAGEHRAQHEANPRIDDPAMPYGMNSCQHCHDNNFMDEHARRKAVDGMSMNCDTCHLSARGDVAGAILAGMASPGPSVGCNACHTVHGNIIGIHESTTTASGTITDGLECGQCHYSNLGSEHANRSIGCSGCHDSTNTTVLGAIRSHDTRCTACHSAYHPSREASHTAVSPASTDDCGPCHDKDATAGINVEPVHAGASAGKCAVCHSATSRVAPLGTKTAECASCHDFSASNHPRSDASHVYADLDPRCVGCHSKDNAGSSTLVEGHAKYAADYHLSNTCVVCHDNPTKGDITAGKTPNCFSCHGEGGPAVSFRSRHTYTANLHRAQNTTCFGTKCHVEQLKDNHTRSCTACHRIDYSIAGKSGFSCLNCHSNAPDHAWTGTVPAQHASTTNLGNCTAPGCHTSANLWDEHKARTPSAGGSFSCWTCHGYTTGTIATAIAAGNTACDACHAIHPDIGTVHQAPSSQECVACHETADVRNLHGPDAANSCGVCHNAKITLPASTACVGCHAYSPADSTHYNETTHTATPFTAAGQGGTFSAGGKQCAACHSAALKAAHATTSTNGGSVTCVECHNDTTRNSKTVIAGNWLTRKCVQCHDYGTPKTHATYSSAHVVSAAYGCAGSGANCHNSADLALLHDKSQSGGAPNHNSCANAGCHTEKDKRPAAFNTPNSCGPGSGGCHQDLTNHGKHNLDVTNSNYSNTSVSGCTNSGGGCHGAETRDASASYENPYHPDSGCVSGKCHTSGSIGTHKNPLTCQACHDNTYTNAPAVSKLTSTTAAGGHYSETSHTPTSASVTTSVTAGGTVSARCNQCHNNMPGTGLKQLWAQHNNLANGYANTTCSECHNFSTGVIAQVTTKWTTKKCDACHTLGAMPSNVQHATTAPVVTATSSGCGSTGAGCHNTSDLHALHKGSASSSSAIKTSGCAISGCHDYTKQAFKPTKKSCGSSTSDCHKTSGVDYHPAQNTKHTPTSVTPTTCFTPACHANRLDTEHDKWASRYSYSTSCALCHARPQGDTRIDWATATADCGTCHPGAGAGHTAQHESGLDAQCQICHHTNLIDTHADKSITCAGCHSYTTGTLNSQDVTAAIAGGNKNCVACHVDRVHPDLQPGIMASFHSAFGPGTNSLTLGAWVSPWTQQSQSKCTDCHVATSSYYVTANDGSRVYLERPYPKTSSNNRPSNLLCFKCHNSNTYGSSGSGSSSGFENWHTSEHDKYGCFECHEVHGSKNRRLIGLGGEHALTTWVQHTGNYSESDCGQSGCSEHNRTGNRSGGIVGKVTDGATAKGIKLAKLTGTPYTLVGYTDRNGNYYLPNLYPGSYSITASWDGYSPKTATVSVSAGATATVNFTLGLPGTIMGKVTQIDGITGITGATVKTSVGGYTATTGAGGVYTLSNVDSGAYTVTASKTGYTDLPKSATVASGGTTTVDFALVAVPVNPNLALNKTTYASGSESGYPSSAAVDGNAATTRWWTRSTSSGRYLTVNLGSRQTFRKIVLKWHSYYARTVRVDVSDNNSSWTTGVWSTSSNIGGTETITLSTARTAQYVRVYLSNASSSNGFSIWEYEIYAQ